MDILLKTIMIVNFAIHKSHFPALASIDSARVIYLGNFFEGLSPRNPFKLYGITSAHFKSLQKYSFFNFESTTSILSQLTMAKFMEEGEWSRHISNGMCLVYKRKMQHLVSVLKKSWIKVYPLLVNSLVYIY